MGENRGDGEVGGGRGGGDLKRRALKGRAEVCGYCKTGIDIKKGSERWNDSMKMVEEEKKKLFEEWLQRQNGRLWERYKEKWKECKEVVNVAKREARWRWGRGEVK